MSLSLEQVRRIAHLARIEISESEAITTQGHLNGIFELIEQMQACLLYTSPSPRDRTRSRMPSSA